MTIAKKSVLALAAVVLIYLLPRIYFCFQVIFFWLAVLLVAFNSNWIDRHVTQRSGLEKIPEVSQMEALFGKGDHSVSDAGAHLVASNTNDIYQWSTDVYFGGRYQLMMIVNVEVDRHSSEVSQLADQTRFILLEIERVDMSRGSPSISYDGSAQREFGATDWKKVVEAKGDFSVIGIQIRNDPAIPNFDELVKWSQLRSQQRYNHSE